MNGIEKLIQQIDAEAQSDAIQAKAAAEAAEVKAQYAQRAERESQDILDRGRKAAAEREERLAGVAQLERRKTLLAVKQEMLDQAFEKALEELQNLPEKEYVDLVSRLVAQAAKTGKEEVIFSQKDRPRYGKAVVTRANEALGEKGRLTLSAQTRPIQGGFILSDGEVEVNGTFDTLVRLQRRELDGPVAKLLFQDQV